LVCPRPSMYNVSESPYMEVVAYIKI
jgi:hypothetical protein